MDIRPLLCRRNGANSKGSNPITVGFEPFYFFTASGRTFYAKDMVP